MSIAENGNGKLRVGVDGIASINVLVYCKNGVIFDIDASYIDESLAVTEGLIILDKEVSRIVVMKDHLVAYQVKVTR